MALYNVSFKKNNVYQCNLCETEHTEEEIAMHFLVRKNVQEIFGIHLATNDDIRPDKPIVKF